MLRKLFEQFEKLQIAITFAEAGETAIALQILKTQSMSVQS